MNKIYLITAIMILNYSSVIICSQPPIPKEYNPLSLTLYAAALSYEIKNKNLDLNDPLADKTIIFPSEEKLTQYLEKNPLLSSPWLHKKGLITATAKELANKELLPLGVEYLIAACLHEKFSRYQDNPFWDFLQYNLSTAAKDYNS